MKVLKWFLARSVRIPSRKVVSFTSATAEVKGFMAKMAFPCAKKRWEFAGLFLWWVVLCVKSCRTFAFFGFGFALMFKLEILGHWSKGQGKFVLAGDHRGATYQLTSPVLKPPKLAQLMQLKQLPIYQ